MANFLIPNQCELYLSRERKLDRFHPAKDETVRKKSISRIYHPQRVFLIPKVSSSRDILENCKEGFFGPFPADERQTQGSDAPWEREVCSRGTR